MEGEKPTPSPKKKKNSAVTSQSLQCESKKSPLRFSVNFFPNGWEFSINFYTSITRSFLH